MIELKLRVWDLRTEKLRDVMGYDYEKQEFIVCSVPTRVLANGNLHTIHGVRRSADEVIPFRYSGLADTKGVGIYDGDVIQYTLKNGNSIIEVVHFGVGAFWLGEDLLIDVLERGGKVEVIRNIKEDAYD